MSQSFYTAAASRGIPTPPATAAATLARAALTGNPVLDWLSFIQRTQMAMLGALQPQGRQSTAALHESVTTAAEAGTKVLPIGEEMLNVGVRKVVGATTVVRREVVEVPVEQEVTLREERVVIERRPATRTGPTEGILTDTLATLSDSREEVVVWKDQRVVEEIVLRADVTTRKETVRDTVRRDRVQVVENRGAPASLQASRPNTAGLITDPVEIAKPIVHGEGPGTATVTAIQPQAQKQEQDRRGVQGGVSGTGVVEPTTKPTNDAHHTIKSRHA